MTVAELGFRLIIENKGNDFIGAKINRMSLPPEETESVKQLVGKKYSLKDIISTHTYVFDLTKAMVKNNELIFNEDKLNFYRI